MATFSIVERRLFQRDEADRISEALSRAMRQITVTMLISETPIVANVLTTDVVLAALMVLVALLVALMVLLTVLIMDDSILSLSI